MRIAIIGSGIAGLGAAWMLDQRYDITVYEAADRLGGHSNTVDMPTAGGRVSVDTGFIVYNERNYPNLTALFAHLGVPTQASDMSFGVSVDGGRLEYSGGESYGTLFAQKSNLLRLSFHRMLADILRFNAAGLRFLECGRGEPTLDQFLLQGRFGHAFKAYYLIPMSAAIWSSSLTAIGRFPARSLLQFFANHGLLSMNDRPVWRTVQGGSKVYVEKMTAPFAHRARAGRKVQKVLRANDAVDIVDSSGAHDRFDAVVLACHADQALNIIDRPSIVERTILGAFDYQENRTILHSDAGLMPKRRAVWSSWNYMTSSTRPADMQVSVSYWLNHLQRLDTDRLALVSLNPLREPDPDLVVGEWSFAHPQFTAATLAAQQRLNEIQGRDRLWYCGAHWGHGFHEDGLLSGLQVAAGLGITPPWWSNVTSLRPAPAARPALIPEAAMAGGD